LRDDLATVGGQDVDHVDVLVRPGRHVGGDILHADGERGREYGGGGVDEPGFGGDLAGNASFLSHLAYYGLGRVFVGLDVPAGVQPPAELSVLD
jgi:hypothetical protein